MPPPDYRLAAAVRLHHARNYPEAEQAYRFVLAHQPNHTDALLRLGTLLHETGRHEESIAALRRGVAVTHHPVELRRAMVGPLVALGDLPAAMDQAREVVRLAPTWPDGHLIVAQLLYRTGNLTSAEPSARKVVELSPNSAVGWLVLARILTGTDRPGDAMAAFDRAVMAAPTFPDAVIERAYQLQQLGRFDEAVAGYEHGLQLAPNNLTALNNVGTSHVTLGRPDLALRYLRAAVKLSPGEARPLNNLGVALREAGRIDEALASLIEAVQADPSYAAARGNIGLCHAAVGEHRRALEAYHAAEAIDPDHDGAGSKALLSLLAKDHVEPAGLRVAHVEWARRHADPVGLSPPPITDRRPDRRLRVGYLSPDFRDHPIRPFIEPVLAAHDRSTVEVYCYAASRRRDKMTQRLVKLADHWHDVASLTAAATADLIRAHEIDVLVDLAGHTTDNRLLALARRPAPVQVTYLGYPATTGMAAVNYRLTDAVADPAAANAFHAERLVRLPDAFFVYAGDPVAPYDPNLPADANGHVTFGAFNSLSKVTTATLATWAQILSAVPGSRLVFKANPLGNPSTRATVLAAFEGVGVTADRLDLHGWVSAAEHAAMLGSVDLMLDTFPYNGHATTCQGLWMGAPTLTRYGNEFRGRVGLSIMTQLAMPAFAVASVEDYVQRAIVMATDLSLLRELRPTWRERMLASPLCDAARFTRGLEDAYRQMWTAAVGLT